MILTHAELRTSWQFQTRLDPLPAARSQREVTRQQSRPSDHSCRRSFRDIMAGRVVWQPRTQIIHHIVEDGAQTIVIPCNFSLEINLSNIFVEINVIDCKVVGVAVAADIWWLGWYLLLPLSDLHINRSE